MSYVPSIAVDVFIRSVTKLWKPNIDGRTFYVNRSIIQGKSLMNLVFLAISLRVLYCYPSLNIVEEKNVKKIFRQKIYFDYVLLNLISWLNWNYAQTCKS